MKNYVVTIYFEGGTVLKLSTQATNPRSALRNAKIVLAKGKKQRTHRIKKMTVEIDTLPF